MKKSQEEGGSKKVANPSSHQFCNPLASHPPTNDLETKQVEPQELPPEAETTRITAPPAPPAPPGPPATPQYRTIVTPNASVLQHAFLATPSPYGLDVIDTSYKTGNGVVRDPEFVVPMTGMGAMFGSPHSQHGETHILYPGQRRPSYGELFASVDMIPVVSSVSENSISSPDGLVSLVQGFVMYSSPGFVFLFSRSRRGCCLVYMWEG